MVNILSQGGKVSYGVTNYLVDTEQDIIDLPINVSVGSTVFVIETQMTKMLNSKGEWVRISLPAPPASSSVTLDGGDA